MRIINEKVFCISCMTTLGINEGDIRKKKGHLLGNIGKGHVNWSYDKYYVVCPKCGNHVHVRRND